MGARLPALACAALLAIATATALVTAEDYGVTWDEGVQARYGELALAYFRSGGEDARVHELRNLRFYGPLFETLAALAYDGAPERRFEIRHRAVAAAGLLGLAAVMAYARAFRLAWLPALAGAALVVQPRYWGHLFANSKDVPFAAATAAALAVTAALLRRPGAPWPWVAAAGAALGVAAALRPGGLPLLGALLAAALLADAAREAHGRPSARALGARASKLAAAGALAWVLMVLAWPSAHARPLAHPLESIFVAASFDEVYPVLFEGRHLPSRFLPARYVAEFVAIATPLPVLALAALGVGWGVRVQRRAPWSDRALLVGLTELWLFLPLLLFAVLRPNVYDGLRHFLFVLPALAVLAALGARAAVAAAPAGWPRAAAASAVLLALAWPVGAQVRLHPYQASYFNALVGGVGGAAGRFETDYWASSYKEAMAWLAERAAERDRPVRVLVAATELSRTSAAAYAVPGLELSFTFDTARPGGLPPGVDYFLSTTRWRKHENFPAAPVVHTVGRDGAVFAVIKGREARPRPAAAPR